MLSQKDTQRGLLLLGRLGMLTTALLAVMLGAPAYVAAQCAFNLPSGSTTYTGYLSTSLVRAFVSCNNPGGNTPNTTSSGGVPSCAPVETFAQQAGSPANSWEFHNGTSYGRVTIKRSSGGGNLTGFPPTLRDATVTVKLYHIGRTDGGGFASGTGDLQIIFRATLDDYNNGDMTYIDFPVGFSIQLAGSSGSGSLTKKIGDYMLGIGQPRLPDCTSMEIVSIALKDPNGNVFATSGVKFP